jgi:hypothetical protein
VNKLQRIFILSGSILVSFCFIINSQAELLATNIEEDYFYFQDCTDSNLCTENLIKEKQTEKYRTNSFWGWLNNTAYAHNVNKSNDNKQTIRQNWQNFFGGVDIFYAYFKAKETEEWIEGKGEFTIFKHIKGKPEIKTEHVKYIFYSNF